MQKGKLLALVMALVLMLAVAASAGATVKYEVIKPRNYSSNVNYPVVYVMPEDGYRGDGGVASLLAKSNGIDAILVKPSFSKGMDLYTEMETLVAEIDSKYQTIASPNFRAIVGTGTGAYLSYMLAMTDNTGAMQSTPALFGFIAGINGNYTNNKWYTTYGDLYDKLNAAGADIYTNYFSYMDAPVGGVWTNVEKSSNNIGQLFMDSGKTPDTLEYTVRLCDDMSEFMSESVSRVADRMATWMLSKVVSGTVKLEKTVMPAADAKATAIYNITLSNAADAIFNNSTSISVNISVIDPSTDEVLSTSSTKLSVTGAGTYNGEIAIDNTINGKSSDIKLSVTILNASAELDTAVMMREQDPVFDGDYQHIDLMGDWHFKFVGPRTENQINVASLTKSEYETWSVVQPGLGNWTLGYGNISIESIKELVNPMSYVVQVFGYDFCILGAGYYAKTIELPAEFTAEDVVLSIGNIDDRCEVFFNGTCVGRTGMDENGNPLRDPEGTVVATWDVYSYFDIDSCLINYGGTNTVVVRAWNDTSYGAGGWYSGPIGLYSKYAFENPKDSSTTSGDTEYFYEETFYSDALGYDNQYLIYLPQDYYESDRFYPTMYLLHQYNSTHTSYRVDAINELMDDAVEKGLFDEMIVVIPNSAAMSFWSGPYETMVVDELIPHIESKYRAIPDARYRMTAGCSMGGYGAFAVAQRNPNHFSGLASFFGAINMGDDPMLGIADKTSAEYLNYFSIAFICGNQDSWGFDVPAIDLNKKYEEMGVDHYFYIENGGHDSAFYVPRFQDTVAYVRNNMYQMPEVKIEDLLQANYGISRKHDKLFVSLEASEAIRAFYLNVPDSEYTIDTHPGVTLPVMVTIKLKGGDEVTVRFNATFNRRNLRVVQSFDLNDILPKNAKIVDVKVHTQLLGGNYVKNDGVEEVPVVENPDLPETGDNSNIFFFAALLMASVVGMAILAKKRAAC